MKKELLELVYEHDELAELDPGARHEALRWLLEEYVEGDVPALAAALAQEIDGYGVLSPLMCAEGVTDILVNGPDEVWAERSGRLELTDVRFEDAADLAAFVERMLARARPPRRADLSHPIADARLPDGARLHVVLPPLAPTGPVVSIRRFPPRSLTLADLVARAMLTTAEADYLADAVAARRSIAISGGTGSGKTTLLNALLGCVPPTERVVVIEETAELAPACRHLVSLLARPPNVEGRGGVELHELVRAALRMRPDRIVIGEVRGAEALASLAAMSTGHEGSMVTIHARSAADVVERMVSLARQASSALSERSLRAQVQRAFELIVHLAREPDGTRRVVTIEEA